MSIDQGKKVVALARETLESFVESGQFSKVSSTEPYLAERRGVFVTLNTADGGPGKLRGCVGFPYPVKPLGEAVQEAAVSASSQDPRFPPVRVKELDKIVVEVSVLTLPVALDVKRRQDMPSKVRVGEDGLIVSTALASGLLLPQVATEYGMDAEEFLSSVCMKAGLAPDSWLLPSTTVLTFQADIFGERTPRGEIGRVAPQVT